MKKKPTSTASARATGRRCHRRGGGGDSLPRHEWLRLYAEYPSNSPVHHLHNTRRGWRAVSRGTQSLLSRHPDRPMSLVNLQTGRSGGTLYEVSRYGDWVYGRVSHGRTPYS